MSFVTTVCGGAAGSAAPPEPCPHSGAATTEATATVAHQRAQCVIPTSVEGCGGLLPRAQREPDIHVAPGSGLIIPSRHEAATHADRRGVDRHRPDVLAVEDVVEAHERPEPHAAERPVPPQPHARRPPRTGPHAQRVVDEEAGGMRLFELGPGAHAGRALTIRCSQCLGMPGSERSCRSWIVVSRGVTVVSTEMIRNWS